MSEYQHVPVMLQETLEALNIKSGGTYIDLTLGGAGHFENILKLLKNKGTLIGIDKDQKAIENALEKLGPFKEVDGNFIKVKGSLKIILMKANFARIKELLAKLKVHQVDGILADLGLATDQYQIGLGISYLEDAPLDMRMESGLQVTATDLLNGLFTKELEKLFWELGNFTFAKRLAKEVVLQRKEKPITTTRQLTGIIQKIVPYNSRTGTNKHPEAKVFQALRIAVNQELQNLQQLLPQAFETLAPGGRMVTIAFHSGEDRIIKEYFNNLKESGKAKFIEKLLKPKSSEIDINKRSHSAKLRVIEKI